MKHHAIALMLAPFLLMGCQSRMQKFLARYPGWERSAQALASKRLSDQGSLAREAFPNRNNPVHVEIWNALWKSGKVGDGFGWVCLFNDSPGTRCYLVTLSALLGQQRVSYFYVPRFRRVLDADDSIALAYYQGDKSATLGSIRRLVAHLAVLRGYEAFAVEGPADIPHTRFQGENPQLSFPDFLLSKGVVVNSPRFLHIEHADSSAYSECNVFVYMPCGGQLLRYQVRCRHGKIVGTTRFLVATEVGDWWAIM